MIESSQSTVDSRLPPPPPSCFTLVCVLGERILTYIMTQNNILDSHGGLINNNLGSLLHLDDNDYNDEMEDHITFKLSEYYDTENISSYIARNHTSINIMSFNAESIWTKLDNLKIQLDLFAALHHTIHIISVHDSWVNNMDNNDLLNIENYTTFIQPNQIGGQKGGIVTYVHNSLNATRKAFFEPSKNNLWEGLTLTLEGELLPTPITIHTVYGPPREKSGLRAEHAIENHKKFMDEFKPYIESLKSSTTNNILLGDLNYNLLEAATNSKVQEYFDLLISNEFIPQITAPTKINKLSCNLYDHIFTKVTQNLILDSGIFITSLSDHLPTFLSISAISKRPKPKYKIKKDLSEINMKKVINKLEDSMQQTKFETCLTKDPSINHSLLTQIIDSAIAEIPTKK